MEPKASSETKFPTGTLVFGLVILAIGLAALGRLLFNFSFDAPLLFIALVAAGGLVMIISGVAAARKNTVNPAPGQDPHSGLDQH